MKSGELWETVVIFAAIASLWFCHILRWQGLLWRCLPYVMLALLAWILVRRICRLKKVWDRKGRGGNP